MIHVQQQNEPAHFDNRVRQPGGRFLQNCPKPTTKQWSDHAYWTRVLLDLHTAYGGICAYSCHWIPYDTGARTVEHFKPKSKHPQDAYEWDNYRLVCNTLNGRKGDQATLDPFEIPDGLFIIDFPSLLVKPAHGLPDDLKQQVIATRDVLKMNEESTCLKSRAEFIRDYCQGEITFTHLERRAPFLAKELLRQGLKEEIKNIMGYP
jgi:hypothetical protein